MDQVSYFNKTVASKDMSGYYLLLNGEYAYNKSYSVGYDFGSIKRLDRYPMGALSTLYICFALKKHYSDFIKAYFDSLKWYREIYMISAEGARNHGLLNVPTDEFFETKHYLPQNLNEQRKIADFIIALDHRIDAQQSLVDNLKKYKRGVFEAFLAKKIRFTNRGTSFADWKWTTISEIGEFLGGLSGKTKDDFGHGSDRFITYMNVYKNAFATADGIMPVSIGSDERQNRIQYGDILFTQSSETVEEVGLSSVWLHNSKPYLNSFCMALRPNSLKQLNPKYLGYVMRSKSVRNQIMKEGQGISRINLSGNRILNVGFWCPSLDEQNKIVEVMESLDSICFLSDEKLTRLKDMKSSFIQQLFI